jgi:hypothetical protein
MSTDRITHLGYATVAEGKVCLVRSPKVEKVLHELVSR